MLCCRIFQDNRSTTILSIFLSHTAEIFRKGALLCFRMCRVSKNFMPKRVILRLCSAKLLSYSTEKVRRRTLLGFGKILVSKSFMHRRGNHGLENFLSHRSEKIRRWTLLSFRRWYPKKSWKRGGNGYHNFLATIYGLSATKFRTGTL